MALGRLVREARTALGDRDARRVKARRAVQTLRSFADPTEKQRRLDHLRREGLITEVPTNWQILVGTYRMFVDFLVPGSRDLYRQTGKSFTWQQVLRFLDEPCAVMDPVGLHAPKESILSHLVQVTHHEAAYDVELLRMFPQGVEELVAEVRQLVEGTHPRQVAIDAIVEHDDYHARLLAALEGYLEDPVANELLIVMDPPPGGEEVFAFGREHFSTPSRFFRYCQRMPSTPLATVGAALGR